MTQILQNNDYDADDDLVIIIHRHESTRARTFIVNHTENRLPSPYV